MMSLSKCCDNCGIVFAITLLSGSGGQNGKRRRFCSDTCKNAAGRARKEGKIETICKQCQETFLRFPSVLRVYCSRICANNGKKTALQSKPCTHCGKAIVKLPFLLEARLYCNRKCFQDSRRKTLICGICRSEFSVPLHHRQIYCTRKCQFIAQSNGTVKISLNGRTGYRTDLNKQHYFKSALEADFARFLNWMGIPFHYESQTFSTANGAYTPDFFLPNWNLFVELKGVVGESEYAALMGRNLKHHTLLKEQGVNLMVITQKQFANALKDASLWKTIPNLEQRNYRKTRHLVQSYEDQANSTN